MVNKKNEREEEGRQEKSNYAIFSSFPSLIIKLLKKIQFLLCFLQIQLEVADDNKLLSIHMMTDRIRTISVGECESDVGINDVFSSSIHSEPSLMNTSQISTSSQDSRHGNNMSKSPHNLPSKKVRNKFNFFLY